MQARRSRRRHRRGAGASLSSIPTGIDLGHFLPQGSTVQRSRCRTTSSSHAAGTPPYGLAIVFNIACAGQVRLAERSGTMPQQIPIQCTDENGIPLSPNDYVIGINRVYSYADRTNTNPVVERVTLDGVDVDLAEGHHGRPLRRRPARRLQGREDRREGLRRELGSQSGPGASRQSARADLGDVLLRPRRSRDEARLLFDSTRGRVSESDVEFRAPYDASEGTLWAVVHDNRAGAAFVGCRCT